jgi:hypothetical protein
MSDNRYKNPEPQNQIPAPQQNDQQSTVPNAGYSMLDNNNASPNVGQIGQVGQQSSIPSSPVKQTSQSRYKNPLDASPPPSRPSPQQASQSVSQISNANIPPNNKAMRHDEIWPALFGESTAQFLPWSELEEKTRASTQHEAIVYKENGRTYFNVEPAQLNILANYIKQGDKVSNSLLTKLFSWFSPIKARDDPRTSRETCWQLEDLITTITLDYFYGWEDASTLEKKLENTPEGTFLVRFSTKTPGGYAIVAKHGKVIAWKVDPDQKCQLSMPCSSKGVYPNIKELVEIHKTDAMPKVPLTLTHPLSKSQALNPNINSNPAPVSQSPPPPQNSRYKN